VRARAIVLLAAAALAPAAAPAAQEAHAPAEIVVRRWLSLDPVDARRREPFPADAVFARHLLDPESPPPAEGAEVRGTSGAARWRAVEANEAGRVEAKRGSWHYATLEEPADRVAYARLVGAERLFVEGDGFVGDVYDLGLGPVPVALRGGTNRLFVAGVRGSFSLRIERADAEPLLSTDDLTVGDLVEGEGAQAVESSWKALNPTTRWAEAPRDPGRHLPPLGVGKVARAHRFDADAIPEGDRSVEIEPGSGFPVMVKPPGAARRVTFRSSIDGSIQFYGFLPEFEGALEPRPVATVLSLHGAGVDALGQAQAYGPKPDFRVVAPTNRRPFGFNWHDWGRRDAYEALEDAMGRFGGDPSLVHLTGHSMGGHGAWHLAAMDPDRWAAVAPSAGWRSIDTYADDAPADASPLVALWRGADFGARPQDLAANLVPLPTFVLHGADDDVVPADEARAMIAALEAAGARPRSHFAAGRKHWWDDDPAPGADCVDWPGIFDLFRRARRPAFPARVAFVSPDPSANRQEHWVRVEQPLRYGEPFRVEAEWSPSGFRVRTENCRRLKILDLGAPRAERIGIDGREFRAAGGEGAVAFLRGADGWERSDDGVPGEKDARLSGPFKRAFDRRFVLVVGTKGRDAENRESLALARWHASHWWARANGDAPVVRDLDLLAAPERFAGRNLVLYGNEETNAAWARVVPASCPLRVRRGAVRVGDREWTGEGLGALLVHPRADDEGALVGAFGSTGVRGSRVGYTLSPFGPGVGYPDWTVFGEGCLAAGNGGVLAAGWFDHGWGLQPGGSGR
jgi:dienelactone hydrolase